MVITANEEVGGREGKKEHSGWVKKMCNVPKIFLRNVLKFRRSILSMCRTEIKKMTAIVTPSLRYQEIVVLHEMDSRLKRFS